MRAEIEAEIAMKHASIPVSLNPIMANIQEKTQSQVSTADTVVYGQSGNIAYIYIYICIGPAHLFISDHLFFKTFIFNCIEILTHEELRVLGGKIRLWSSENSKRSKSPIRYYGVGLNQKVLA